MKLVSRSFDSFIGTSEQFATLFHKKMSPTVLTGSTDPTSVKDGWANEIAKSRSKFRKQFCGQVVQLAMQTLKELDMDRSWRIIFRLEEQEDSGAEVAFISASRYRLIRLLTSFPTVGIP